MAEPAARIDDGEKSALDERADDFISMHEGDARDAVKTLLLALDDRASRISYGYVRGHLPDPQIH